MIALTITANQLLRSSDSPNEISFHHEYQGKIQSNSVKIMRLSSHNYHLINTPTSMVVPYLYRVYYISVSSQSFVRPGANFSSGLSDYETIQEWNELVDDQIFMEHFLSNLKRVEAPRIHRLKSNDRALPMKKIRPVVTFWRPRDDTSAASRLILL